MLRKRIVLGLLGLSLCIAPSGASSAPRARLALHWLPQAQFAGYYVALEKGFYLDEGVELEILAGNADTATAERLSSGEAQFGTMFLAHAVEHHSSGIPLVNIAQILQHSGLVIVTRKVDGIDSIEDFEGRRVAMWAHEFQLQPWALFKKHGVRIRMVPFSGSMELFLKGAVPATLAMWYNEYHMLLTSGYREEELQPIFFKDTPYDFPEDGIYCLAETLQADPDTARAVVTGSLRGWQYAFEHEEEALAIVRKYMQEANLFFSITHQRWMLRIMQRLMQPAAGQASPGRLSRESFDNLSAVLNLELSARRLPTFAEFAWSEIHGD